MKLTFIASVLSLSVTAVLAGEKNDLTFTSSHGYQFVNNVPSAETSQQMYKDQNIQYAALVYQWSMSAMGYPPHEPTGRYY